MAGRAQFVGARLVGGEARQVLFVLFPGDVGRQHVFDQDQPVTWRRHDPPGAGPPRLLAARIDLTPPIGIGSSIDGVLEQILERHAIWAMPFQLAFGHATADTDANQDLVAHKILLRR
jgi:hypothetical protein